MTEEVEVLPKKRKYGGGRVKGQRSINNQRFESGVTAEQEAYCRARAFGMSVEEAKVAAGLSHHLRTLRLWELNNKDVAKRIEQLSAMATQNAILKTGLTRGWIIERLMSVVERCMQSEPVRDKEGNETGEFTFNAPGANQALKMLGDTMGLFKHSDKNDEDEYANLSDDDIARIAGQLASEVGLIEDLTRGQAAEGSE